MRILIGLTMYVHGGLWPHIFNNGKENKALPSDFHIANIGLAVKKGAVMSTCLDTRIFVGGLRLRTFFSNSGKVGSSYRNWPFAFLFRLFVLWLLQIILIPVVENISNHSQFRYTGFVQKKNCDLKVSLKYHQRVGKENG